MTEMYQTTITISAVPEGDNINFSVTDENDAKTPEFVGSQVTGVMMLLTRILSKSYIGIIQEKPELENEFSTQLLLTFKPEQPLSIEGSGILAVYFAKALEAYYSDDPEFFAFLNS
ncbi:hypothetical protein MUU45_001694 [Rodentibacter pneumotropicus]|uniref:Uncharacterized protein n=1 Tax=Rodentibacter pneumotropicus TaxID=758 RepID=A0AAW5LBL3_9PAST|nr:hypothetical protein [Rodentibacter pneumotropicus]MCQ9121207.1 hypothetical protein [Rodentibacter pneumotropicus]